MSSRVTEKVTLHFDLSHFPAGPGVFPGCAGRETFALQAHARDPSPA